MSPETRPSNPVVDAPHDASKCVREANIALASCNARVKTETCWDITNGVLAEVLALPVVKIKPRGPKTFVRMTYCPFCGAKL